MRLAFASLIALIAVTPALAQQPDFAGRDKKFAYMRTAINRELAKGPNFAGHYTIVTTGCGTGCTSNLLVDRNTGKIADIPYGGEEQQMLTLKYNRASPRMVAMWQKEPEFCVAQRADWNGKGWTITAQPKAIACARLFD